MNKKVLGIFAHVDAGKTTLSEALLYRAKAIRTLGRVDHKNTFLDQFSEERARGITIFSKQALFSVGETAFTLLDTPGHTDFSGEAERTLRILDMAVLLISASDGVQSHTRTLFQLLSQYRIPTLVFVNKMDIAHQREEKLCHQLLRELGPGFVPFSGKEPVDVEAAAVLRDDLTEKFLAGGGLDGKDLRELFQDRKLFPVFFGSALRLEGIDAFMEGLEAFSGCGGREEARIKTEQAEPAELEVYKITYSPKNERLTHVKVLGGELRVKDVFEGEKIQQIRLYNGEDYEAIQSAGRGDVVALVGPEHLSPKGGALIHSYISYEVLPSGDSQQDRISLRRALYLLMEEDPLLQVEEAEGRLFVHLMGQIQLEILSKRLLEQGFAVTFGEGQVIYRETLKGSVYGVGHYEPLRHYAEVHLSIEEGKRGQGIVVESRLSTNVLDKPFQHLVLNYLRERPFYGPLTGSELTDVTIALVNGKSHIKHTEGGDFHQATRRALRQGLLEALAMGRMELLEPFYDFSLKIPAGLAGKALADLDRLFCTVEETGNEPEMADGEGMMRITGYGPVVTLEAFGRELKAFSHGLGELSVSHRGYFPCHNTDEVLEAKGYLPELDQRETGDSVFCAHGAGFAVPHHQVKSYMHLEDLSKTKKRLEASEKEQAQVAPFSKKTPRPESLLELDRELLAIFERTYGPLKAPQAILERSAPLKESQDPFESPVSYLLLDGYNIIYAWEDLKQIAKDSPESAREKLMDMLCVYQSVRGERCILVFDAYNVPRPVEDIVFYHNIVVIYTKEAQTADSYIEQATYELAKKRKVRVVTSDYQEQLIVLGHGAIRVSSREFRAEMEEAYQEMQEKLSAWNEGEKPSLRQAISFTSRPDASP